MEVSVCAEWVLVTVIGLQILVIHEPVSLTSRWVVAHHFANEGEIVRGRVDEALSCKNLMRIYEIHMWPIKFYWSSLFKRDQVIEADSWRLAAPKQNDFAHAFPNRWAHEANREARRERQINLNTWACNSNGPHKF